ncbi:PHD-type domain-containing protein [Meloidogyne graminicola]|uniref:PHD-type domain-containing protein n=1 Tax=Meloidogyne graminicola TaxID=189291 RepID=A0A8S9ZMJ3_9BILA|nr:PHD-type domain-containing protein [Meloidogyne graminicola]
MELLQKFEHISHLNIQDPRQREDFYNGRFIPPFNKNGETLSNISHAIKALNSREFSLEGLGIDNCYYKLPFDEIYNLKNEQNLNKKMCFYCKRFDEKQNISCDFCPANFCLDCLSPPLTATSNELFMCPLHIERFVGGFKLNSLRVTDRMALWKEHNKLEKESLSIFFDFYSKIQNEKNKKMVEIDSNNYSNKFGVKSKKIGKNLKLPKKTFEVNKKVKEAYKRSENFFGIEASENEAVNILLGMRNGEKLESQLKEKNISPCKAISTESDVIMFHPDLFNNRLPIFGALKLLYGADKITEENKNYLIPLQSKFITIGGGSFSRNNFIDLSFAKILIFTCKLAFEMVALFPCIELSKKSEQNVCNCLNQKETCFNEAEYLIPSTKNSITLWSGALNRKKFYFFFFLTNSNIVVLMEMSDLNGNNVRNKIDYLQNNELIREPISEEELLAKEFVTPEDVLRLNSVTEGFLCRPEDNVFDIEFVRFKVRDIDSETVLFEITKPEENDFPTEEELNSENLTENNGDEEENHNEGEKSFTPRFIRYYFKPSFLRLRHIGATMEFVVGDKPVSNFRMIERHYFRDRLLKSFDFDFGFIIPNSRNSCEHIYHMPRLSDSLIEEMLNNPFETKSDSLIFYFVDNRLIMHNKADYCYAD